MLILLALAMILANTIVLVATILSGFQLPGNWVLVLLACGLSRWGPEPAMFSFWLLAGIAIIALGAELIELAAGSAGARRAGSSRKGAFLALLGSFAGGILGTFIIPVIGSIIGACAGAFLGALVGARLGGRPLKESLHSGKGAAWGRLAGMGIKFVAGALIWLITAIAAFWP